MTIRYHKGLLGTIQGKALLDNTRSYQAQGDNSSLKVALKSDRTSEFNMDSPFMVGGIGLILA